MTSFTREAKQRILRARDAETVKHAQHYVPVRNHGTTYAPNGEREVARRKNQLQLAYLRSLTGTF